MTARRAIFFDIDGVLNREPGANGVVKPDDIVLLPGAGAAVAAAKRAGFLAVGITNRAQVARGLITLTELEVIFERLQSLLAAEGAPLDKIYFCPHHPEGTVAEFAISCECRKPGTLLFRRAIAELSIDPARSITIGDNLRDIAAGKAMGTATYGVRTGHGCKSSDAADNAIVPDRMFDDVGAAIAFATRDKPAPRILYVVSEDWYFLSHRLPMARAAREAGFEVHVATNVGSGAAAIAREGFTLHPVPFARGRIGLGGILATITSLRRVHRKVTPAITHRVALQPTVLDAIAAIGLPSASINAITGLGDTFVADTFRARVLRKAIGFVLRHLVNRKSNVALVQNPDDGSMLAKLGFPPERIAFIPGSGTETASLAPQPEPAGPPTAAIASRLLAVKGIHALVAAHRLLRQRLPTAELLVAGAPDPANAGSVSQAEIAAWSKEPGVRFLGHVSDIASVWARAHLAVLPSRGGEGIPKSLLDAAACGRAMVATDVPGCREIVVPGETGLLVPVDDAPALAAAMEKLLTNADLRREMGQAARRLAETRFSADAIGRATVDLYRRLADNTA